MSVETRILRLDASATPDTSASRKLGNQLIKRIQQQYPASVTRHRDLNRGAEFIDADWIGANLAAAESRDEAARQRLANSDELIDELKWADHIVLTTPMYNFGVPATLKAWIDQVCRAGITFRYSAEGPVGLLEGKRVDIIVTTGGAPLGSAVDFVSPYLRQVFGFIGIDDVEIIAADGMNLSAGDSMARATDQIEQRYPELAA